MNAGKRMCMGFAAFLAVVLICGDGCSKEPSVGCFYVEIAPAKFVPVKFTHKFRTDMKIKYDGQVVTFKLPRDPNSPSSLMEFEGKLYVLALDASAKWQKEWQWRCYQQDGNHFKEIPVKDFPKSIAIMNIWRAGNPTRYSTGRTDADKIDAVAQIRELNTEDVYFLNSDQARLWYMLDVQNNFEAAYGGSYNSSDPTFVRQYITRYKPVRLTSMELKPVPKDECNF